MNKQDFLYFTPKCMFEGRNMQRKHIKLPNITRKMNLKKRRDFMRIVSSSWMTRTISTSAPRILYTNNGLNDRYTQRQYMIPFYLDNV